MKPGERVASPRSMICALSGMGTLLPATMMVLPSTTTTPLGRIAFDLPSKSRAALRPIVADGSAAKALVKAQQAQRKREKARIMGAGIEIGAVDCKAGDEGSTALASRRLLRRS